MEESAWELDWEENKLDKRTICAYEWYPLDRTSTIWNAKKTVSSPKSMLSIIYHFELMNSFQNECSHVNTIKRESSENLFGLMNKPINSQNNHVIFKAKSVCQRRPE